jgi:Leucine-rich repeat (LRR) protein
VPSPLIEHILRKAGPHSRELCKALAHLYGPLLSLTPRNVTRIQDLLSTLTRQGRHKQLKALDLSHVTNLVTDNSLKLICRALPHLERLHLPLTCKLTTPALAALQPLLPSSPLTALQISSQLPYAATAAVLQVSLDMILQLTRLRELALPACAAVLLAAEDEALVKLGACSQLTQLSFSDPHCRNDAQDSETISAALIARCAECLPALASLKVGKRFLFVETADPLTKLRGLTALTELHVATVWTTWPHNEALHAIGAMANLRTLQLRLLHLGWDPAESGWLTRLSLLTSLDVCFETTGDGPGCFDEVLSAVPHLPALRRFHMSSNLLQEMQQPSDEAFASLASASGVLEQLHLSALELPRSCMEVIRQLTRLTALRIRGCDWWGTRGSFWTASSALAALTSLRVLEVRDLTVGKVLDGPDDCTHDCTVAPRAIEGLKQLRTLRLNGELLNRPYITRLCAALPQLCVLDVSGSANIGSGVSALSKLTNLEEVDLSATVEVGELVRHLKPPTSLRRFLYKAPLEQEHEQHIRALLGPRVRVVFDEL